MINHKLHHRFIAMLLTIIMVLSMIPASAVEAVTKGSPSVFIDADDGSRSLGAMPEWVGNTEAMAVGAMEETVLSPAWRPVYNSAIRVASNLEWSDGLNATLSTASSTALSTALGTASTTRAVTRSALGGQSGSISRPDAILIMSTPTTTGSAISVDSTYTYRIEKGKTIDIAANTLVFRSDYLDDYLSTWSIEEILEQPIEAIAHITIGEDVLYGGDVVTVVGLANGDTNFKLSLSNDIETVEITVPISISSNYWDGTGSRRLENGDTVDFAVDPEVLSTLDGQINIEEGATVTINNDLGYTPIGFNNDHIIGNNATIIFTGTDSYLPIVIDARGKILTLEALGGKTISSILTTDTTYEGLKRLVSTENAAASIRLRGSGEYGFTINDTLAAQNLIIDGGSHTIYPYSTYGRYDGSDALILKEGGSLIIDGSLTLRGCPMGSDYNPNALDGSDNFISGKGLVAEGNANVSINAGSSLKIYGGNEHDADEGYLNWLRGGAATSGDIDISFASVSGGQASSLTIQNGKDFTGDEATGPSGNVTVIKSAGAYLAGSNWLYDMSREAYEAACASYAAEELTVKPPVIEEEDGECTPARFIFSVDTPDVITFTAVEYGGKAGTKDSQAIELTFNTDISNLPSESITLTDATAGTPVQVSGNKAKWRIPISDIDSGTSTVTIAITAWDDYKVLTGEQNVTLYRSVTGTRSFSAGQYGGKDGKGDTTAIMLTFNERVDNLTYGQITLDGADKSYSDTVYLTPYGDDGEVTDEYRGGFYTQWLAFIEVDSFANNTKAQITLADWEGGNSLYDVDNSEVELTLYRETRTPLTYTAVQVGGESNISDSTGIKLTFDKDVEGLTGEQITLINARVASVTGSGKVWTVNLAEGSLTATNGATITITIANWADYRVDDPSKELVVYAMNRHVGFSLYQIGGVNNYNWSNGILIRFSQSVLDPSGALTIEGVEVGDMTDYGDEDGRTWYLPITNFDFTNATEVTAIIEELEGLTLTHNKAYTRIFKDNQRVQVKFTVEQVGGEDGTAITTALQIKAYNAYTGGEVSIPSSADLKLTGASITGRTTVANVEGTRVSINGNWENGDELTLRFPASWRHPFGTVTYETCLDADTGFGMTATTTVYKDTRTHVKLKEIRSQVNGVGLWTNRDDSTEIRLKFDKEVEGLTVDKISLTGAEKGELTKGDDGYWYLGISNLEGNYCTLAFDDWYSYHMPEKTRVNLSYDNRNYVALKSAVQVGGISGKEDSGGILLSFHGDISSAQYFDIRANADNGSVVVGWEYQWVRVDGERCLQIKLQNHSYTDGTTFTVSIKSTDFNHRLDLNYENAVKVKLYRGPEQPGSYIGTGYRKLSGVAPYSIDVNSSRKEITLLGQMFGLDSSIEEVHIREKTSLIGAGWHTISLQNGEGRVETALTLDVSELEMFEKTGTYEVRYQSSDGFRSTWQPIHIVDNDVYSQDGYGLLAITQDNKGNFAVQPFEGDRDMKAALGSTEPILTFRGGILVPSDDHPYYRVQSGTVINKVLTYYDLQGTKGDTALKVIEKANGDISIATAEGALYWKNVPITASLTTLGASTFDMSLYTGKRYTTDRLASYTSGGDPVEINTGNEFEVNFLGSFEANMSAYKLYGSEVAISGGVSLQFPKGLETVGISIDEEEMGAGLKMEKLILDTTYRTVPGMLANGYIHFNPANMLGESFGELLGSANLDINVDTLPETSNWTIEAKGDLEIAELIYVRGEMVLEWGKVGGYYIMLPEDLEFFARLEGEGMGIPLVPPVIVAYMNGIGGSIKGISSMIRWMSNQGYKETFVPPGEISLSGAIKDATGEIFSIDEAAITLGVGSFSSYAREATLLKYIGLEDVGFGFGVRNSTIPTIVGVPGIDVYFNMGGKLYLKDIEHVELGGGFNLSASVYGSRLADALYDWMKAVKEKGYYVVPDSDVKRNLKDAFDIDGRVYAYGYIVSKLLGRVAGAEGTLAANKTRISGSVRGKLGPLEKDVQVTYYTSNNEFDIKLFSLSDIDDSDDSNDDVEVALTNVHLKGSYRPGTSDTGYEDGKLRLFATGFGAGGIPEAKKDEIAVIYADEKYVEIKVWKDGELFKTLDMDDIVIWSDNETEDMEAGKYIAYYEIPADGSYVFKAEDKELAYNLIEITPLAGFETVTASISDERAVKTSWGLNDVASGSGKTLYTRLLLMDAETGDIVLNLNPEGTDGGEYLSANSGTHTVYLPETFGSGTYYVSAELIEMDKDGYIVLDIMNSDNIEYTNPDALPAPENVSINLIGNGAFTASWNEVDGADGYRITILDESGNKIPGISILNSDTNSISIIGGMNVSSGDQYTGLEYDKIYKIKVQAYQNKEYYMNGEASGEDDESYTIPIIGKAYTTEGFRLPAPQIPDLYVSVDGANYIEDSKEGVSYFATNKSEPSLTIRAEYAADIKVYIGDMEEASHTAGNVTDVTIPLSNLGEDGIYEIRITAETTAGDYAETGVTISLDTLAPVLHVDGESFYAQDGGKAWVTGFTELGVSVTLNGEPLTVDGGLFEYEGDIDGNVMEVYLIAYDHAGNTSERIFSIINTISNASDVLELSSIRNAVINEREITATVGSSTSSIELILTVSNGATWKLYSDAGCTKEIAGKTMNLLQGENTAYIKVTAEDKVTNKLYSLVITRAGGGGGTHDGGSSNSTPEALKPLIPGEKQLETVTTATVDIKGNVKSKVLSATITEKMVKDAIKAAQEAAEKSGKEIEGISLDFNITSSKNHTGLSISMDEGAIKLLKEAGVKLINIGSSILDISIDAEAIAEIEKQSTGRVHISATVETELSEDAEELIGSRPVFDITVTYEQDDKVDAANTVNDVDKADKTDNKRYITDFGKGAIILGIAYEPAEDEAAGSLYGVYVDKEGKPQLLTRSAYEDGRLIFRRNSLSIYGVGYKTPETVYTDIADHWAKESIEYMVSRELMTGSDEEEFSPDSPLTRRELAEALGRLAGVDVKEYKSRSLIDVKSKENYASYIEWAYKEDIIKASGTSKKRFYPDKEVTREELAEILVSYAKATDYTLPVMREAVSYADISSIGVLYREAVTGLQQAGIMMGKADNKQTPKAKVTRAELSAILHRYIRLTIDVDTAQGWAINDEGQYLYYKEGKAVTGEETIDDIKHSFDKNGVFEAGWRKKDKDTYYYLSNKPHMGWLTIATDEKKETYYFDEEGIMVFGKWLKIEDKMYYFYEDGRLKL